MVISNIPVYQKLLSIQDLLNECSSSEVPTELHNIVTIELPRNSGIGTKAPLQIRLRNAISDNEYCRIKYGNETEDQWKTIDIKQTNEYIRKYQDDLFKENDNYDNDSAQLTNSLIILEICRKNSCDLTIIDLPGITHVDPETERMVKDMVKEYIEKPKNLVLFAHNATTDFVSDECINLIKKVSEKTPENETNILKRIIPVLTKIDLATTEELIRNIEDCDLYKFKYPPILVRNSNRGNDTNINDSGDNNDTNNQTNYIDERKNEQETINKHLSNPRLKKLCTDHQGINGLIKKLVEIQSHHLFNSIDEFNKIIGKTLKDYNDRLEDLPKVLNSRDEFFGILNELAILFNKQLLKKFKTPNNLLPEKNYDINNFKYCLESQIRRKFEEFKKDLNTKFLDYLELDYYIKIKQIRSDSHQFKLENYCGEDIIYDILKCCINEYFEEFNILIEGIDNIISKEVDDVFNDTFKKDNEKTSLSIFDKYYINITELILNELKKEEKESKEIIQNKNNNGSNITYIYKKEIENYEKLFYDFTGLTFDKIKHLRSKLLKYEKNKIEEVDWDSVEIMCSVYSYLKSFMDRMLDSIFKEIDIDLMRPFKSRIFFQNLQQHFYSMNGEELEQIMYISDDTRKKIDNFSTVIEKLKKAKVDLNSINKNMLY
eukprot:jgi/Orpsp1_1/1190584/evm.model.d7180000079910.1